MCLKVCDSTPKSQLRGQAVAKSVVSACLMRFCVGFWRFFAWSFSMLLELRFLSWWHRGYGVLNLIDFDGVKNLA